MTANFGQQFLRYVFAAARHATAGGERVATAVEGAGNGVDIDAFPRAQADAIGPRFLLLEQHGYVHSFYKQAVIDDLVGVAGSHGLCV